LKYELAGRWPDASAGAILECVFGARKLLSIWQAHEVCLNAHSSGALAPGLQKANARISVARGQRLSPFSGH
jgi:hypothetical protein